MFIMFSCASTPNPEDVKQAEAYNKLGLSYLNDGQLNEAYIEFQKSLNLNPDNKETLNYLGLISTRFNKYDEAISYYNRAIALDPKYSEASNNLGVTYAELKDWDKAIKYFKDALADPTYRTPERAYSNMGYAYYMKGEFNLAESTLKEALLRNPVFPNAMFVLGLVYVKLGSDDKAITEFKRAIGINSDYLDAHWEIASAYMRKGNKAKSLKHLKIVAEKEENNARIRRAMEIIESLKYSDH